MPGTSMILPRDLLLLLPCSVAILIAAFAVAPDATAQGTALETGKFGDWIVHQNAGSGPKICFAASLPKLKEPAGANRAKIVLYVSAWPKEGVKTEFSVKLGYTIKAGSPVAVSVGTDAFELFSKDDRAYVADPTEELKMIEAMKSGQTVVVKATSAKGTATTDTYSLKGLDKALQAVATACP
jgi:invasion protein IalB